MILKRFNFGNSVLTYIEKELENGNSFARKILEVVRLQDGEVATFIPSELHPSMYDFGNSIIKQYNDHGGVAYELQQELQITRVNLISQFLSKQKGYVIFEILGRPNDPAIQRETKQYFTFEDDVFLYLSENDSNPVFIQTYWETARCYPRIIGLSSFPKNKYEIKPGKEVEQKTIDLLADRMKYLIIGAYDDEGYLLWRRNTIEDLNIYEK